MKKFLLVVLALGAGGIVLANRDKIAKKAKK